MASKPVLTIAEQITLLRTRGIKIDVPNGDIFFDELKLEKVNSPSVVNNR